MSPFIERILYAGFWSKIFLAVISMLYAYVVSRRVADKEFKIIQHFLILFVLRDIVYTFFLPHREVMLIFDLFLISSYFVWLYLYTKEKKHRIPYLILAVGLLALILSYKVIGLFTTGFLASPTFYRFLLFIPITYLAVKLFTISHYRLEQASLQTVFLSRVVQTPYLIIVRTRIVIALGLALYNLLMLMFFDPQSLARNSIDSIFFTEIIVIPLLYLLHLYIIYQYSNLEHEEKKKAITSLTTNLETSFDFMRNIGDAMKEKHEIKSVLQYTIDSAVKSINAEGGAILLVDKFGDQLNVEAISGFFPPPYNLPPGFIMKVDNINEHFMRTHIKMGETIIGESILKNEPILVKNSAEDERLKYNVANKTLYISSIMVIPLMAEDKPMGVLAVVMRDINKFFTEEDFNHLKTYTSYTSITLDNLLTYVEMLENKEIEKEVELAASIQEKLLPKKLPPLPDTSLSSFFSPAFGVSSDYFDIIPIRKNNFAMIMCDVAGKGMPAALVMLMVRSFIHLLAGAQKDAATIVSWINRGITGQIDIDHIATLCFLTYNPLTKEIEYSNAGHNPLLLYRSKSGTIGSITSEGLPIGLERASQYTQKRLRMENGDILLLYTDGIVDAMNSEGHQYSLERLKDIIDKNNSLEADDIVAAIKKDLRVFEGSTRKHDDQTLLVMKIV